jgi:hypothetical protein
MKAAAVETGANLERFAGLEPDKVRQERAEAWEERLQALARRARIDVMTLPAAKSHPTKARLAAAMKASCSVSNAWLAEVRRRMVTPRAARRWGRVTRRVAPGRRRK